MLHRATGGALFALIIGLGSVTAAADQTWSETMATEVRVHEHSFDRLIASGERCEFVLKLYFDAPEAQYADQKNKVRNFYRFRARIRLADGRTIDTRQFFNRTPGARMYTFREDTTGDRCWSEKKQKVVKLDVLGCRGQSCRVQRF